ncbi:hypothetical protein L596_020917 [Steinernema carpocapsae]|uniref:Uncharacterized protein n=1 Tax=Steinernema carpocapsae TaxID=34508 RepID=A0A4U5MV55_STECR|nr:hypothetical protein L596_020917 [Steinernema carpocapsae]
MSLIFHLKCGLLILGLAALVLICLSIHKQSHRHQASNSSTTSTTPRPNIPKIVNYDDARKKFEVTLDEIKDYRENVNCANLVESGKDYNTYKRAEKWHFNDVEYFDSFGTKTNICQEIARKFSFVTEPMSQEEFEFPLAYSLLVHDNGVQVLFLLSALYQPQNQFCIAVDESTNDEFKRQMFQIGECFPNVFVMIIPKVRWCGFSVLQGVYSCVEYLARLKADWKYYQYLSGVDLPLKTNLEMVRIFKKLNGSFNAGIYDLPANRYKPNVSPPMVLWKSSLSATFSRESANYMVHHPKVQDLYEYLKGALCPDETFWTTLAGNPADVQMPGGFNATLYKSKLTGDWDRLYATNKTKLLSKERIFDLFKPEKYYISRYQVWYTYNYRKLKYQCFGRFTAESCVFGVGDLPSLIKRPELVAHKFYHNMQPAAYFCLYEHIRRRALKAETNFSVDAYGELPGPKLLAGTPFEEIEFRAPGGYEFY